MTKQLTPEHRELIKRYLLILLSAKKAEAKTKKEHLN